MHQKHNLAYLLGSEHHIVSKFRFRVWNHTMAPDGNSEESRLVLGDSENSFHDIYR